MSPRVCAFAALLLVFVSLSACQKNPTPEEIAGSFIGAVTRMDIETAYALVSAEARAATPMEKAISEKAKLANTGLGIILELLADKTVHQITGSTIDGDTAMVRYTLTSPDLKPIFQDPTFSQLIRSQGNDPAQLRQALAARLNESDVQTQSQEKVLALIREDGKWVVKNFSLQ